MIQIRVGYEIIYDLPQPTPLLLTVHIHYSRAPDIVTPDHLVTTPPVPVAGYRDLFGNWISRIVAPGGQIRISGNAVVNDSGRPDPVCPDAVQHAVQDLPEETLLFLLGSRYCETDRLSETAWGLFGNTPPGWARVQAICDFVHNQINSATNTRARPRPPGKRITRVPACAGTLRIWQWRSAVA